MSSRRYFPVAWAAGAAIAATQVALSSSAGCSLPQQGRCTVCGGCILALAGLTGWALFRRTEPTQESAASRRRST
ncbi:MAG: hypothetical protein MI754_11365 [Chromatiales bacterium]|nr:hypothetical protein [Chromatiales bacterium]